MGCAGIVGQEVEITFFTITLACFFGHKLDDSFDDAPPLRGII
jgi:hypothetical protein